MSKIAPVNAISQLSDVTPSPPPLPRTAFCVSPRRSRRGSYIFSGLGPERVPPPSGNSLGNSLASGVRSTTASTADMTSSSGYTGSSFNGLGGHHMASPPPTGGGFMTNASSNGGGYMVGSGGHHMASPPNSGGFMGSPPHGLMGLSSSGHGGGYMASPPNGSGFMTSSAGNMASPTGGLNAVLRERFAWGGRAESSGSFNGEAFVHFLLIFLPCFSQLWLGSRRVACVVDVEGLSSARATLS